MMWDGFTAFKRASNAAIITLSAIALLFFLVVALNRISYPNEIESLEGMILDHAWMIYDGKPLYHFPDDRFITEQYTPVNHLINAGVWILTGPCFWSPRLVSILCTLLSAFLIFSIVRLFKVNIPLAVGSAGLFLATYYKSDYWFDVIRIDMLPLAFFLATLYVFYKYESLRSSILMGLLAALTCLTKQNYLLLILFFPLNMLIQRRFRDAGYFMLSFIILFGGVILWLHLSTDGWSTYQIFASKNIPFDTKDPSLMGLVRMGIRKLIFTNLKLAYIPSLILLGLSLYLFRGKGIRLSKNLSSLIIFSLGAYLQTFNNIMHVGGYLNHYIITYAMLSILWGCLVSYYLNSAIRNWFKGSVLCLFMLQFIVLYIGAVRLNAWDEVPNAYDITKAKAFRERYRMLRRLGPVFMPYKGYWSRYFGDEVSINASVYYVLTVFCPDEALRKRIEESTMLRAISSGHYAVIIWGAKENEEFGTPDYNMLILRKYRFWGIYRNPPRAFAGSLSDQALRFIYIRKDINEEAIRHALAPFQDVHDIDVYELKGIVFNPL